MKMLLPMLQMGWQEKKKKGCAIWRSFAFVVVRTSHARI